MLFYQMPTREGVYAPTSPFCCPGNKTLARLSGSSISSWKSREDGAPRSHGFHFDGFVREGEGEALRANTPSSWTCSRCGGNSVARMRKNLLTGRARKDLRMRRSHSYAAVSKYENTTCQEILAIRSSYSYHTADKRKNPDGSFALGGTIRVPLRSNVAGFARPASLLLLIQPLAQKAGSGGVCPYTCNADARIMRHPPKSLYSMPLKWNFLFQKYSSRPEHLESVPPMCPVWRLISDNGTPASRRAPVISTPGFSCFRSCYPPSLFSGPLPTMRTNFSKARPNSCGLSMKGQCPDWRTSTLGTSASASSW
jgi:hypothetical protein